MRAAPSLPLDEILEDAWDRQLFRGPKALALQLGWTSYHTLRSKGSKSGYPDRTLVRDRILFVELKRELTGRLSEDRNRQPSDSQREWLDKIARAGGEVYLWRPSDLEEIAAILSKRWCLTTRDGRPCLAKPLLSGLMFGDEWTPRSLWIPGLGRSDTQEQQTLLATQGAHR